MIKIANMTTGFCTAVDYMSNTGVGIHKDNPEVWDNFFQKTVLQVCPSYYLLEETLMQYYNPTILRMRLGDKDEQQRQETRSNCMHAAGQADTCPYHH